MGQNKKISKNKPKKSPARLKGGNKLTPSLILLGFVSLVLLWYYIDIYRDIVRGNLLQVHFIDVGQGDATLILTGGRAMLIDGGDRNMGERVIAYIEDLGVRRLDYVIATHPHSDHIGGLISVLPQFEIGTLIMPQVAHTTRAFEDFLDAIERNNITVNAPVVGNTLEMGNAIFTIIAPNSRTYSNMNDYSIALRLDFGTNSFIFTGDAESTSEAEMVSGRYNLFADVLHVGHHGSSTSTTEEFLWAVSPTIAVISVGANNPFGHPHASVLARLADAGIQIYRTDVHGHIVILSDGEEVWLSR